MLRLALAPLAILIAAAHSIQAADPLDCMPNSVRLIVVVDHPRKLAETITHLDAVKQAASLPQYQQLYDSPTAQRLFKMLEYAEKELGAEWPTLLDQLAGNGLALGLQIGSDPAPAIAIASGTDSKQVERAFELAIRTFNVELARQGAKDALVVEREGDVTRVRLGADFHFARVGSVIIASSGAEFLTEAIARARDKAADGVGRKARANFAKVLPKNPLAWAWLNFGMLKETKSGMDFFDTSRQNFILTMLAGSTIDCLKRSDFVVAGLYQEANDFRLRLRLPAGREGLWSDLAVHVPPKGTPGSLPLLDPPGTIYSQSFHLDLGYVWKNRETLITGEFRKQLEEGQKAATKFLPSSVPLGELLQMWGPYHRIVIVEHDQRPYKTQPAAKFPAFGYVATMRDKRFGENVEAIARAAALIGVLQFGMKSTEVEHEGATIMGYRFPENKELAEDPQGIRYNFEPCFARVGDELVIASTIELAKKLITELKKPRGEASTAVWRARVSVTNGAAVIAAEPDALITDAVLSRGVGLGEARKDVAKLVDWARTLGVVRIELDLTASEYRLDVVWTPGKK